MNEENYKYEKDTASAIGDKLSNLTNSKTVKIVLISVGVLAVIGLSGYLFKLMKFSIGNFKELRNTIKS